MGYRKKSNAGNDRAPNLIFESLYILNGKVFFVHLRIVEHNCGRIFRNNFSASWTGKNCLVYRLCGLYTGNCLVYRDMLIIYTAYTLYDTIELHLSYVVQYSVLIKNADMTKTVHSWHHKLICEYILSLIPTSVHWMMVSFGECLYIIIGAYLEGGRLHSSLRYSIHHGPQGTGHWATYTAGNTGKDVVWKNSIDI